MIVCKLHSGTTFSSIVGEEVWACVASLWGGWLMYEQMPCLKFVRDTLLRVYAVFLPCYKETIALRQYHYEACPAMLCSIVVFHFSSAEFQCCKQTKEGLGVLLDVGA